MSAKEEIRAGSRFAFGENWARFLGVVSEERIAEARNSLIDWIGSSELEGRSFLDVGCGSGLFSLAARQLGARVVSFDIDPDSVACCRALRQRYMADDPGWEIREGSILDEDFVQTLGKWDVVYSWGVLHHSGNMWQALDTTGQIVRPGGSLFIALYNDQGKTSEGWTAVKRAYNRLPRAAKPLVLVPSFIRLWGPTFIRDSLRLQPTRTWRGHISKRGMSAWTDLVDWVGGYPFEVAKPEEVFDFFKDRGFTLTRLKTCGGGLGCNEFVFRRAERK